MFEIQGAGGRLQVGHRVAATLGRWTLVKGDEEFVGDEWVSITVTLKTVDKFWVTQLFQFELVLLIQGKEWRWRGDDVRKLTDTSYEVHGLPIVGGQHGQNRSIRTS